MSIELQCEPATSSPDCFTSTGRSIIFPPHRLNRQSIPAEEIEFGSIAVPAEIIQETLEKTL